MPSQALGKRDEVDQIVETLLADPDRAEDVKSMLRSKLRDAKVVRIAPVSDPVMQASDAMDDMWDNVPV